MKQFPKVLYVARQRSTIDTDTYFNAYDAEGLDNTWNGHEIAVYELKQVGTLDVKTTVTIKPKSKGKK